MSVIRADDVAPSAGGTPRKLVRGTAASWANLDGTGTIALRDSENVSSVVDNATGDYTFNFSNSFSNNNYSAALSGDSGSVGLFSYSVNSARAVGSIRNFFGNNSNTATDAESADVTIHGDLA